MFKNVVTLIIGNCIDIVDMLLALVLFVVTTKTYLFVGILTDKVSCQLQMSMRLVAM